MSRLRRLLAAAGALLVIVLAGGYGLLALLTRSPPPPRLNAAPPEVEAPPWPDGTWSGSRARLRVLGGWIVDGFLPGPTSRSVRLTEPVDLTSLRPGTTVSRTTEAASHVQLRLGVGWRGRELIVTAVWSGAPPSRFVLHLRRGGGRLRPPSSGARIHRYQ